VAYVESFLIVSVAGLVTALATGLGALPFFIVDEVNDRLNVVLWGLASGIMLAASLFGLVMEGFAEADPWPSLLAVGVPAVVARAAPLAVGALLGAVLVVVAHEVIEGYDVGPRKYAEAEFKKLLLVLGVLTVHSFPEGVAVGVSFADLNLQGGVPVLGLPVPLLAAFMTLAISVHNIPEGVAVSIPLQAMGVPRTRMVWWAVFSSLPQPVGAVLAYAFVRAAREFLPLGFGFAAGAMVYLVLTEFVPEALEVGEGLPGNGYRELAAGIGAGVLSMVPLAFI